MSTDRAKIKDLIAKVQAIGEGSLDEIVHDLKSAEASSINNGGATDQINYIVDQCGYEKGIKRIEEAIKQ